MKKVPWTRYNKLIIDLKKANLPLIVRDEMLRKMRKMSATDAVEIIGKEFKQALKKYKDW
jgi:hypothetical protein